MASDKNKSIKTARIVLYFILIFSLFFTYIMSKNIIISVSGNLKSTNWEKVDARLLSASIKKTKGSKSSVSRTQYSYYRPEISYEYNYNNINCVGSKVYWTDTGDDGPMQALANKYKSYYQLGKLISIYVNPNNPCESIAERKIIWPQLKILSIVSFIMLLIASGAMYLLVKKLKLSKVSY